MDLAALLAVWLITHNSSGAGSAGRLEPVIQFAVAERAVCVHWIDLITSPPHGISKVQDKRNVVLPLIIAADVLQGRN